MLSKRIQKIESSGIRKIFELATKNNGEYVNLSIGQPHFKTSEMIKDAAKKAIDDDLNTYAPTKGIAPLRKEIAESLKKTRRVDVNPENIIITSGTSGAIFLLFSSIFNPGDEVILPDPAFVMYKQVLIFLGVEVKFLDTYPDFHINSEKLKSLITENTKAIILNSPNNPTGAVYDKKEVENIVEIAKENDLVIISDEVYDCFDYDNKFFSPASIYEKTFILSGFSKSHSITGWRAGFAYGPSEVIEAMNKFQQYTFVCAPSFVQYAMLGNVEVVPKEEVENYKKKRDFVYDNLKDFYELSAPEGAFYAFIKMPITEETFMEKCFEEKILVVPGSVFSEKQTHFRISFAVDDEQLKKGVETLQKIAKHFSD